MFWTILGFLAALALLLAAHARMSAHNQLSEEAYADWAYQADPGNGKKFVTGGPFGFSNVALKIGSGSETNTLPDPDRVGLVLTITVYSRSGGTRAVAGSTKINVTGNTTLTFSAVDHSAQLISIAYSGNTNKCRWQVIYTDGPTLS